MHELREGYTAREVKNAEDICFGSSETFTHPGFEVISVWSVFPAWDHEAAGFRRFITKPTSTLQRVAQ